MPRKKKAEYLDTEDLSHVLLGEEEPSGLAEQLSGMEREDSDAAEIPEGTTTAIATAAYLDARNKHEDCAKLEKQSAKDLQIAESILYRVLEREDLESVRSKSGVTLTAYERKVGSLTVTMERAIEMIKEEGLDRELLSIKIETAVLNAMVNKWVNDGVQIPAFVKLVGIPKISINRSKSSK